MSYAVLARRYRSQSFDELVAQDPITRTLRNAIEQNRVGHAYLFCGTRGVGKTSTARLFAKALNAPGDEPADVAEAIMQGRDVDVIEIDGASTNKVDDVRELIANCVYRPLRGRKKIYIIDEVHAISTQAFQALLKTMEEPPEHVVFILCTTESHKVPATIQSRCQRFDFRPIPTAKIAEHLRRVLADEKIKAEPELVHMVARLGNGSMRDALSLLDRLLAAHDADTSGALSVALLESLLGMPDRVLVTGLIDALADGDAAAALTRSDELLKRGTPIDQFLSTLADRLRDLMVMAACGAKTDLVEISPEARAETAAQAARFDPAGLVHMIALCDSVARAVKNTAAPRAVLDALMVRLAMTEKLADVTSLVSGRGGAAGISAPAGNGSAGPKKR
ncbi:MAG: DNA polymerase III subunit gamma/tau [Phycisphaeraceae bacterium]|nr:DNA polymerase III subunit gamma/tau [Phycisphaeraceae bacterium]